jgi:PAS domain S-box-containing protein
MVMPADQLLYAHHDGRRLSKNVMANFDPKDSALILVVDDDAATRFMTRAALEQGAQHKVVEAEDGLPAITLFQQEQPDIILLDVMMPGMDGFTACMQLRQLPNGEHTPILMMTGLEDMESIDLAYQVGATDFITKPINFHLLRHRVQYMLRAKYLQDELRANQAKLANAQRIAKLGHWEWDPVRHQIHWSNEILKIFGWPISKSKTTFSQFIDCIHPGDRKEVSAIIAQALRNRQGFSIEHRILRMDGKVRTVQQNAEFGASETDKISHLSGTIQDLTERRRAEQRIQQLAFYDKITGLPNRLLLNQQLSQVLAIAKSRHQTIAALTLDVDNFKRINDTLGHNRGDALLQAIARRLMESLCHNGPPRTEENQLWAISSTEKMGNIVTHFGGDEFVILLTGIRNAEDAAVMARRIGRSMEQPISLNNQEVCLTVSIGISIYPEDARDGEKLLAFSSAALNHAKSEGRKCHKFYTASMNARALEKLSLENDLRKAIDLNQLQLHYQPKVGSLGKRTVGMEALVRWKHPSLGFVSPAKFIPIAEETSLIIQIGEWVFREACRQAVEWQKNGLGQLHVSLNLSAIQFSQKDLPNILARLLKETGMNPSLLELEVTESLLIHNIDAAVNMLNRLKELGICISIDDFGTGYSSLAYLKRLPLTTLKIDQSFVRGLSTDEGDRKIVRAVIGMATDLGLKVVAEGVETEQQFNFLREHGCHVIQGYFFSRPLPPNEFVAWVRENDAKTKLLAAG